MGIVQSEKNSGLESTKSPYLVEYSSNVATALNFAIQKNLSTSCRIEQFLIQDYLKKKKPIPIWIVNAACKLNNNDLKIPLTYQNLWFCLHNSILTRQQPSGRRFRTKVSFANCYINSNQKITFLLEEVRKKLKISQRRFSELCGYKKGAFHIVNTKHPIAVILKACQILKIEPWKFLEKCELSGKTSSAGKIIIPEDKKDIEIYTLLIWLRTEGHLELGSTHIEINQKNDTTSLDKLKELFIKKFMLKNAPAKLHTGQRGEDRLIISSAPLRQLLCLKYNLPIGYKNGSLQKMHLDGLSELEYKKIMPAFIQTEGCLSYHYSRNKKKKLPIFEFIVKDGNLAEDCLMCLNKLGYEPKFYIKQNIFKVGLYDSKKVINLIKQTEDYFWNKKKITYLKEKCTNGIGL